MAERKKSTTSYSGRVSQYHIGIGGFGDQRYRTM